MFDCTRNFTEKFWFHLKKVSSKTTLHEFDRLKGNIRSKHSLGEMGDDCERKTSNGVGL